MTTTSDRAGSRPRRRVRLLVVGALVVVLVVAIATALVMARREPVERARCRGLGRGVAGLSVITGANGFSQSGPSWYAALTEDGLQAGVASRQDIAAAVAADATGYQQVVEGMDGPDRAELDLLRSIAVDPGAAARRNDPDTRQALAAVHRLAAPCGLF